MIINKDLVGVKLMPKFFFSYLQHIKDFKEAFKVLMLPFGVSQRKVEQNLFLMPPPLVFFVI